MIPPGLAFTSMNSRSSRISPWIERTRLPVTYQGVCRDVLLGLTEVPAVHDVDLTIGQSEYDSNIASPARVEQKIWNLAQAIHRYISSSFAYIRSW